MKWSRVIPMLALIAVIPFTTNSADLNIYGNVVVSPCVVDSGSVNQDVDFGQLLGTHLRTAGASSEWVPFQVKLIACPVMTTKVFVTFDGTPYSDDLSLYENEGSAQNIAIELADANSHSSIKGKGSSMTVNVDSSTHDAIVPLAAHVVAQNSGVVAGQIRSTVLLSFTWQ